MVCFNTQPREGGCHCQYTQHYEQVGFNTQPREGGCIFNLTSGKLKCWFQHTAARRRLRSVCLSNSLYIEFQHTAARRRLQVYDFINVTLGGFNTQPREGGCLAFYISENMKNRFQHTAARRRLHVPIRASISVFRFQHTAARRRLLINNIITILGEIVSTHSRAKAAARKQSNYQSYKCCFNTQPREGGCTQRLGKAQKL